MTMAEKKMNSIQKEIEKLEKSLDRYKGLLEKSSAATGKTKSISIREMQMKSLKSSGQHGSIRNWQRVM